MKQAQQISLTQTPQPKRSSSPYGESYILPSDPEMEKVRLQSAFGEQRPVVVIQGLGFVGAAMTAALVQSRNAKHELNYNIIGVDLLHVEHYWKIARANLGLSPILSRDSSIDKIYTSTTTSGNFTATYHPVAYSMADVIIVDVNVDVDREIAGNISDYKVSLDSLHAAIVVLAQNMKPDALILVETTLPPGTTEKFIAPIIRHELLHRKLPQDDFRLAYAFERVMPGRGYMASILSFYRAFAGIDIKSAVRTRNFLESFVDTVAYPLHELGSTTACEMAKVLENSYRATNIAFIDEWTTFAHQAGVNLYEIVDAIRVRPTHSNIMAPGFGVGGYCLTKDALLGDWSLKNLYDSTENLDFSCQAISVNDRMPEHVMNIISEVYPEPTGISVAILGISYRPDVADTRNTPAAYFSDLCLSAGMLPSYHDPLVTFWIERNIPVVNNFSELSKNGVEVVVFALPSQEYRQLTPETIMNIFPDLRLLIDANNVLTDEVAEMLFQQGIQVAGLGKGHWNHYWRAGNG